MNNTFVHIRHPIISSLFHHYFIIVSKKSNDYLLNNIILFNKNIFFGSCMPAIFMSLCNSHDYERLYFQKSIIETVLLNHMSK